MAQLLFERLTDCDLGALRAFCYDHWPGEHPLIHNEAMFEYYYRDHLDGGINFAVAREAESGAMQSVCGYIKANDGDAPDVWISFILTKKGAALGLGFKLLELIRKLTNCRTIACNNIRKKTRGLYEFLGWYVGDETQYYRLNERLENYTICCVNTRHILSVSKSDLSVQKIETKEELGAFDFAAFSENKPYKDRHYIEKRYFNNPWIDYEVYAVCEHRSQRAILVVRQFETEQGRALRVVDFVGQRGCIAGCGQFLDGLMRVRGAEFVDWFAYGIKDEVMAQAGFTALTDSDPNIIPFYLDPPTHENVTVSFFTSDPDDYCMFRADGDQDRPNI